MIFTIQLFTYIPSILICCCYNFNIILVFRKKLFKLINFFTMKNMIYIIGSDFITDNFVTIRIFYIDTTIWKFSSILNVNKFLIYLISTKGSPHIILHSYVIPRRVVSVGRGNALVNYQTNDRASSSPR